MLRKATTHHAVAAAVCYRRTRTAIQILLVKTSGGHYWTFPKGHIRKKERDRPWAAAAREAQEEAGVVGTVRERPLTVYRYPGKARKGIDVWEDRVTAFLLEVTNEGRRHERGRKPMWCHPGEAKARLADGGRETIYAIEQSRVIDAALATLR
jgi:8-oxo-dGTP pyrophosphatase MutT (NUDIX family)